MSDCADMTTALARELTQGIKNEVEDLSAVFKKMAILKSITEAETDPNLWCLSPEVTETEVDLRPNRAEVTETETDPNLWCLSQEVTETELPERDKPTLKDETVDTADVGDVTDVIPAPILYAPPKQQNVQKSDETDVLQRFRQFRATVNASGIPNHVLLEMVESMLRTGNTVPVAVGIPDDFDPFAEEAA